MSYHQLEALADQDPEREGLWFRLVRESDYTIGHDGPKLDRVLYLNVERELKEAGLL